MAASAGGGEPPKDTTAKDLVARAREATDLVVLLKVVGEAPAQQHLGASTFATLLSFLANKPCVAPQGAISEEALRIGEDLLKCADSRNGGKPYESAVTAMVRLCCSGGKLQRALALIEEACAAGMKPKVRTFGSILLQAADASNQAACEDAWSKLARWGLEPQDMEFATMLRGMRGRHDRQLEVLRQMLVDLPLPSDPLLIEEIGRVFGVEGVGELQGGEPPSAESSSEVAGSRWRVGWTSIDAEGICALSSRRLQALQISPAEEKVLFDCTSRLANDSGCNSGFRRFQTWISNQEPYDVVIDGANVAFTSQNRDGGQFQYHQIDAVVRHFQALEKRVLLVLHPKWCRGDANLGVYKRKKRKHDQITAQDAPPCPGDGEAEDGSIATDIVYPHEGITQDELEAPDGSPLHAIRTWKESGILLCVPVYDCDDWYWLYAALDSFTRGHKHVQVISNDNLRDHHWRMHGMQSFVQWQDRHMTRFSTRPAEDDTPEQRRFIPELFPPRSYSRRAQVSSDGSAWHFLVPAVRTRAEQLQSGRPVGPKEVELAEKRWMAAWRAG